MPNQSSRNNRVTISLWEIEILQLIISEGSNIFDLQCTGRTHQSSLAKKCFCLMPLWKLVSSWLYVLTSDGIWASKPLIHQRWMLLVSIIKASVTTLTSTLMTSASCNWKYLKAIYEYLSRVEFNQLAFSVLHTNVLSPETLSKYIKIVSNRKFSCK